VKAYDDNTYDIEYGSSDREVRVPRDLLRPFNEWNNDWNGQGWGCGNWYGQGYGNWNNQWYGNGMWNNQWNNQFNCNWNQWNNGNNWHRFREGEQIRARWQGKQEWRQGRIVFVHEDNTYDIEYECGERESRVPREWIRRSDDRCDDWNGQEWDRRERFYEGEWIRARWQGKQEWRQGRIVQYYDDNTYDIEYECGQRENRVPRDLIRSCGNRWNQWHGQGFGNWNGQDWCHRERFYEGERIRARWQGKQEWRQGRIVQYYDDNTYDIEYEGGDRENRVSRDLIRSCEDRWNQWYGQGFGNWYGQLYGQWNQWNQGYGNWGGDRWNNWNRRFHEGEHIRARWQGKREWRQGRIVFVHGDGTYDIEYEGGDRESRVPRDLIRTFDDRFNSDWNCQRYGNWYGQNNWYGQGLGNWDGQGCNYRRFQEGEEIRARWHGKREWRQGRIFRVHHDNTYDIEYEGGNRETRVPWDLIRRADDRFDDGYENRYYSSYGRRFREGEQIRARFEGQREYVPGRIMVFHGDDTYDIEYEGGEREMNVPRDLIRSYEDRCGEWNRQGCGNWRGKGFGNDSWCDEGYGSHGNWHRFQEGEQIRARWHGKREWRQGRIALVHRDNTYDIEYEDGNRETRVPRDLIRRFNDCNDQGYENRYYGSRRRYREGEQIRARFEGQREYVPGRIMVVNGDDTYDIEYEGGERESRVPRDLIRSYDERWNTWGNGSWSNGSWNCGNDYYGSSRRQFTEGERVRARFHGKPKYFDARITVVNGDDTYDIEYDDGERESRVPRDLIRRFNDRRDDWGGSWWDTESSNYRRRFQEGERVRARFQGRPKFFDTRIAVVHGDGTYDVEYDDGQRETRVPRHLIRRYQDSFQNGFFYRGRRFQEGQRVQARYRGRPRYFEARIVRANGDGTYDVEYNDGEKDVGLASHLIRSLNGEDYFNQQNGPWGEERFLEVGQRIDVRHNGRGEYRRARITKVNRDRTYNVQYDDGVLENNVSQNQIRFAEGEWWNRNGFNNFYGRQFGRQTHFYEGEWVEARYQGNQWARGRIYRDNHDGSYDIEYENGVQEKQVRAIQIRSLEQQQYGNDRYGLGGWSNNSPQNYWGFNNQQQWGQFPNQFYNWPDQQQDWFNDPNSQIFNSPNGRHQWQNQQWQNQQWPNNQQWNEDFRAEVLYEQGENIEARYQGQARWSPGRILRVNRDGTYDIVYEDGQRERSVEPFNIRRSEWGMMNGFSSNGNNRDFWPSQRVEARYRGQARWFRGRIMNRNPNGTWAVAFEDGDVDNDVPYENIRPFNQYQSPNPYGPKSFISLNNFYNNGERVESRFRGGTKWFPATIESINRRQQPYQYFVCYENGTKEWVNQNYLRKFGDVNGMNDFNMFQQQGMQGFGNEPREIGEAVYYQPRGQRQWYSGRIMMVNQHQDGSYSYIVSSAGRKSEAVDAYSVRSLTEGNPSMSSW